MSRKRLFLRLLGIALCGCIVVPSAPVSAQEVSTKTYTINSSSAFNYQLTGSVQVASGAQSAWYDPAWKYRQRIVINKEFISEDLPDFPVLIRLEDSVVFQHARSDAYDVVFTAADGVTKLAHERDNRTTFWVKVPKVSSTQDTILYVYYGNAAASDQQSAAVVWGEYGVVYHFSQDPAGTVRDSTQNSKDIVSTGGMNSNDSIRAGKIGQSYRFARSAQQGFGLGRDEAVAPREAITVSAWVSFNSIGSSATLVEGEEATACPYNNHNCHYRYVISQEQSSSPYGWQMRSGHSSTNEEIEFIVANESTWVRARSGIRPEMNRLYHVVGTYDGSYVRIYVDGVELEKTALSGRMLAVNADVRIGTGHAFPRPMDGTIDEVRIAPAAKSNSWIRAEYTNQCNCEDFLTISDTVETSPTATTKTGESTITLKPDRPLPFTTLSSFRPNASDSVTYQLSNDGGTTWLFYGSSTSPQALPGWKSANPSNPHHRSSANDLHGHLDSFPQGEGKLLWRAYLPSGTSLDSIQIDYIPGSSSAAAPIPANGTAASPATSLSDARIQSLNTLFRSAFYRTPKAAEWTHWVTRMLTEGKPLDAWLGAMEWAAVH